MSRVVHALVVASGLGVAVSLASCTASLDLDRFRIDEAPLGETDSGGSTPTVTYYDVQFSATSMTSHINEFFEIRVVDKDNHVQAKLVYRDVASADFAFYMKGAVPKVNPPYRLDFWADHNLSGAYDGIVGGINEKDHAWRRRLDEPLPEDVRFVENRYEVAFIHDTNFTDIYTDLGGNEFDGSDTLLDFELNIRGAEAYVGKMMEIRVTDQATGRLVGLHRRGGVPASFTADVSGVIDEATRYEVSLYVDEDGNQKYSAATTPPDPAWKIEVVSTSTGATAEVDLAALEVTAIDTGEPQ